MSEMGSPSRIDPNEGEIGGGIPADRAGAVKECSITMTMMVKMALRDMSGKPCHPL